MGDEKETKTPATPENEVGGDDIKSRADITAKYAEYSTDELQIEMRDLFVLLDIMLGCMDPLVNKASSLAAPPKSIAFEKFAELQFWSSSAFELQKIKDVHEARIVAEAEKEIAKKTKSVAEAIVSKQTTDKAEAKVVVEPPKPPVPAPNTDTTPKVQL